MLEKVSKEDDETFLTIFWSLVAIEQLYELLPFVKEVYMDGLMGEFLISYKECVDDFFKKDEEKEKPKKIQAIEAMTKWPMFQTEAEQKKRDERVEALTREWPIECKKLAEKIGRNDPCPCGSGKKYKKCCMNKEDGTDYFTLNYETETLKYYPVADDKNEETGMTF